MENQLQFLQKQCPEGETSPPHQLYPVIYELLKKAFNIPEARLMIPTVPTQPFQWFVAVFHMLPILPKEPKSAQNGAPRTPHCYLGYSHSSVTTVWCKIRASVDTLCRDGTDGISRDPHKQRASKLSDCQYLRLQKPPIIPCGPKLIHNPIPTPLFPFNHSVVC